MPASGVGALSKKHDSCRSLQRAGAVIGEAEGQSRGAARRRPVGRLPPPWAAAHLRSSASKSGGRSRQPGMSRSSRSSSLLYLRAGAIPAALRCSTALGGLAPPCSASAWSFRMLAASAESLRLARGLLGGWGSCCGAVQRRIRVPMMAGSGEESLAGSPGAGGANTGNQEAQCRGGLEACLQAGRSICKAN